MTSPCFAFNTWPWRYWAADAPDAIAIDSETPLTWQALRALVDAQQRTFNDAPMVVLNSHDALQSLVVTLLAAWQAGKQTLVLNQALSADVQTAVLDNLGPFQWAHAHQSVPDAQSARNIAPWHIDMPLTLTLTSGSTGAPKAVVHGARQHLASAAGLTKRLPFTGVRASQAPDRWLLSLPLYHVSGLAIVWRWLLAGGELGIYPCRGEHLVNALKRVTHASLVPTQLYRVLPALKDEAEPRVWPMYY
ncbi:AMP-binding protein [Salinivibrio costicola]|uniref:AMP-binding protein n=1 Tax=Salinivibrio costicola TaxID=51367 RepID=UPI0006889383|nr:AMP-binding protein [Salinivibrio costicola]